MVLIEKVKKSLPEARFEHTTFNFLSKSLFISEYFNFRCLFQLSMQGKCDKTAIDRNPRCQDIYGDLY